MKLPAALLGLALTASTALHAQAAMPGSMAMPAKSTSSTASTPAMPLVNGEVKKIDTARSEIILKHGDLPNLGMPAMTMAFGIDAAMLSRLKVGDQIKFNAEMLNGKATVTKVESAR